MKIVFICSSLEFGRDGVGDYTRRLASECASRGHRCAVIALNDPHLTTRSDGTIDDVRLIRLPATESWPDRLASAVQWVDRIAPDWVSWQVVAYGFHPRGFLPADVLQAAPKLRGARCHVMLHELWLGLEVRSSLRHRVIGWLQRRGIVCLLDQLQPDCVQTSQSTYQEALRREDFDASVLGLFGNIPIAEQSLIAEEPLARWLKSSANLAGKKPLVALAFGTLHPQWQPNTTIVWFKETAQRLGRVPVLIAAGRLGDHAGVILNEFRAQGVEVISTGELDASTISQLLRAVDFGIAPHPWALIGKSGVAAAMLEHGLPVLVPRNDWRLRGRAQPEIPADLRLLLLTQIDSTQTDRWLSHRPDAESALPGIAEDFLEKLQATSALMDASTT